MAAPTQSSPWPARSDGKQPGRRAHSLSGYNQFAGAETVISRQRVSTKVALLPNVANNPNLEVTKRASQNLNRQQGDGKQPTGATICGTTQPSHRWSRPRTPGGFAAAGGISVWLDIIGNRVLEQFRRVTGSLRCHKPSTWRSNLAV